MNPGPPGYILELASMSRTKHDLLAISYNCSGLGNSFKLRSLLDSTRKIPTSRYILMLQETHISNDYQIKYLWRNNYLFTSGDGASSGCITLLSKHFNILESLNIGIKSHISCIEDDCNSKIIIANIYAPNKIMMIRLLSLMRLLIVSWHLQTSTIQTIALLLETIT